jgi:GTPase SAR1 family protein
MCSVWDDAHRVYNDETVTVQIWDTAGQERFHGEFFCVSIHPSLLVAVDIYDDAQFSFGKHKVITRSYYKGCQGILLVYDALNATSEKIDYWLKNVSEHADEDVKVGVLCNKIDLLPLGRAGQSSQVISGQRATTALSFPLFLTSAKTGSGVDDAFRSIVEDILSSDKRQLEVHSTKHTDRSKVSLANCKPLRRQCIVS